MTQESSSIQWLTGARIVVLSETVSDCGEPNLAQKLAAQGYSHLLLRRGPASTTGPESAAAGRGFRLAASWADSAVYRVAEPRPAVYTALMTGFSPREQNDAWSWRWMGAEATWIVINTIGLAETVTLDVELAAFAHDRELLVALNGIDVQSVRVEPARRSVRIGPFVVQPGGHELRFRSAQPPTVADQLVHNGDHRALSMAVGAWTWRVGGDRR